MKQLIADMRLPEYRYKQLLDAVFLQGIMRFEDMKLLPKTLREKLVEQFGETVVEIKAIHHEKSMQTDKVLFELSDGNRVETVGLFYKEGWNSFCISSQSGCGFGCKFCATGTLGLRRNLTVDEITDQILYFMQQGCSINSISFMGMGEPFANPQVFDRPGTVRAVPATHHHFDYRYRAGYSKIDKRISASQSGLFPPRTY